MLKLDLGGIYYACADNSHQVICIYPAAENNLWYLDKCHNHMKNKVTDHLDDLDHNHHIHLEQNPVDHPGSIHHRVYPLRSHF